MRRMLPAPYSPKLFAQEATSSALPETAFREIAKPFSLTTASGWSSAIVRSVRENPLPPCGQKGIMVLPAKSYSSKNV